MDPDIVIFGCSVLNESLFAIFEELGEADRIAAFTVHRDYFPEAFAIDRPIVPFEEIEHTCPPSRFKMILPLRYQNRNETRAMILEQARAKGYELPGFAHPRALVSPAATVGDNVIAFSHTVVRPGAVIRDNVFFWSNVFVESEAVIGRHAFVASGTVVDRGAEIGEGCFVGPNSTICPGVRVGDHSVIGCGSLVTRDVPDDSIIGPVPAREGGD